MVGAADQGRLDARRASRWALAIFVVAFLVRVAVIVARGPGRIGDSQLYLDIATNLRLHGVFSSETGWPLTPSVRVPPLYPVFLATLHGNAIAAVTIQALLDSAVAAAILFLARGRASARWAIAAAIAWALQPAAIVMADTLQTESLFTPLAVGCVVALAAAVARDRLRLTALAGALVGLAALCRSIGLFVPVALIVGLAATGGVSRLRRHGAVLLVTAALIITPWTIRSSIDTGRLVIVQVGGSINVYVPSRVDWDQQDPGDVWPHFVGDPATQAFMHARTPRELSEADAVLSRRAVDNILSQPGRYLVARLWNYPHLFLTNFAPFTGIFTPYRSLVAARDIPRLLLKVVPLLLFGLLPLVLATFGVQRASGSFEAVACAGVWLMFLAIHLPLWIEYRFWLPAVPFLHVTAAIGGTWLRDRVL